MLKHLDKLKYLLLAIGIALCFVFPLAHRTILHIFINLYFFLLAVKEYRNQHKRYAAYIFCFVVLSFLLLLFFMGR